MLLNLCHVCVEEPYSDIVCSVIVVTVSREVTLDLEVCSDAVSVSDSLNLCILDSGQ